MTFRQVWLKQASAVLSDWFSVSPPIQASGLFSLRAPERMLCSNRDLSYFPQTLILFV
jgi:hypothetical protein